MNVKSVEKQINIILENGKQNKDNVSLETKQIMGHVLNCSPLKVFLQTKITNQQKRKMIKIAKKRATSKPLQHIFKTVEFNDLLLRVNKNVLIPRNETELLADLTVKLVNEQYNNEPNVKVLDLCCGSGAIGITVAKHTKSFVTMLDISSKALKVSKINAKQNKTENVKFVKSNLFNKVTEKFNVIVSNPPYISNNDMKSLESDVFNHEPHLALVSGESGYEFYEKIVELAPKHLQENGYLLFEFGIYQEKHIEKLMKKSFKNVKIIKDYENANRFIIGQLK